MGKGRYGLDLSPSPSGLKATRNNAHQQGDNKDLSTQSSHLLLSVVFVSLPGNAAPTLPASSYTFPVDLTPFHTQK